VLPIGPYQLKNRFILAPMAGVSERPFRVLAFQLGAALCPTELVSAAGLFRVNARTLRYLRYDAAIEVPYSLQLFGGEVEAMVKAAVIARQYGAQIIDLNMGCPVKKVTRSGAGSALLCDPPRAAELVRAIRQATGLPVTAKIRAGWDANTRNFLQMARALGEAGVAALACHPRTRAQGYSGKADWEVLRALKAEVGDAFPIIGNGDVKTVADAERMLETTRVDYVMIGRGALGNPWLFRQLNGGPAPEPEERAALVLRHLREHLAFQAEGRTRKDGAPSDPLHDEVMGVKSFRSHLAWYAHGLHGAAAFRARVNAVTRAEEVEAMVRPFFGQAAVDHGADATEMEEVDYRAALG
jgi:nifR3 family TIM-barrel protein